MPPRKRRRSSVSVAPRASKADQALLLAQKNAAVLSKVEKKHLTTTVTDFDVFDGDANALCDHLTEIPQGVTPITRMGARVKVTSLTMRYECVCKSSGIIRAMLVYTNSPWLDASDYTPAEFLDAATPVSLLDKSKSNRFVVLMDRMIDLEPQNSNSVDNEAQIHGKFFKHMGHLVEWADSDTTGDEQALEKGGLFLIVLSKGLATNDAQFSYSARVTYSDA